MAGQACKASSPILLRWKLALTVIHIFGRRFPLRADKALSRLTYLPRYGDHAPAIGTTRGVLRQSISEPTAPAWFAPMNSRDAIAQA